MQVHRPQLLELCKGGVPSRAYDVRSGSVLAELAGLPNCWPGFPPTASADGSDTLRKPREISVAHSPFADSADLLRAASSLSSSANANENANGVILIGVPMVDGAWPHAPPDDGDDEKPAGNLGRALVITGACVGCALLLLALGYSLRSKRTAGAAPTTGGVVDGYQSLSTSTSVNQ